MIPLALGLVPGLWAQEVVVPVGHQDCAPTCAPACPKTCIKDTCNKVCVPTEKKKIVEKVIYSSGCEHFCLPNCSGMIGCGKKSCDSCKSCQTGCNDGTCHKCGKVKTRKYLIIRVERHEECVPACVAVDAPACAPACKSVVVECAPAKKAEALPTPPRTEKK